MLDAAYRVSIPDFAGPMDLLVYMIRRRELDVTYISVSAIASDYLDWIERMQPLDLDNAGDFILLAAILLQLKAAELLPTLEPERSDVEIMEIDRQRSQEELMALRRSVARLAELEEQQINFFNRGGIHISGLDKELAGEMLSEVSLYDVAEAFRNLIRKLPAEPTHIIEHIPYTLEGQIAFVLSFFHDCSSLKFERLADSLNSRLAVIMTFLAVLELMRLNRIVVKQNYPFGDLHLYKVKSDPNE